MTTASVKTAAPVGDYFLTGVFVMLAVNAVQRVVGLVRGLGFCHFLSEEQLGGWALANSFFVVGVPLALLGLPGSFSKFVEYYRLRNQLGDYLRNVLAVTGIGLLASLLWIVCFPQSFSWLVFHQPASTQVIIGCLLAFVSLVVFSIVYEIVTSLRHVRVVSIMQFLQSVVFAAVGLPWLALHPTWVVLLPSFAIACMVATLPGVLVLYRHHRQELAPTGSLAQSSMWSRIIPFAASLWFLNLLGNMFEVSDRYMLLHLIPAGSEAGQAAVGQYHCGRILPNLLTSVAMMLGGILLPYLSADWEAGRRQQIITRMRQMLMSTSLGFMVLSVAALLISPWLFHYGFGGRYGEAQAILPLALVQATWASLFLIAETYMLCAERGKELMLLLVAGLAVNLGLNGIAIPAFGLFGAVTATATAGGITLGLLAWCMSRHGCPLGSGTLILGAIPIVVVAGPIPAMLAIAVILAVCGRTEWLLSAQDRRQIDQALLPRLNRLGIRLSSLWP